MHICVNTNLKPADFVDLYSKYKILRFIEDGYEPFHLTDTQGVMDEVDDYIRISEVEICIGCRFCQKSFNGYSRIEMQNKQLKSLLLQS